MQKLTSITFLVLAACSISSCALVTVPVKVVGKVATTSVGVAGKAAKTGLNIVTPN